MYALSMFASGWFIANAVCIVVPLMFMAGTPVGAISNTVGFSGLLIPCLNVFVTVWYIELIRCDLPAPPPPVKNIWIGCTSICFKLFKFLTLFLHQESTLSYA